MKIKLNQNYRPHWKSAWLHKGTVYDGAKIYGGEETAKKMCDKLKTADGRPLAVRVSVTMPATAPAMSRKFAEQIAKEKEVISGADDSEKTITEIKEEIRAQARTRRPRKKVEPKE
jgi:hypothetical protein